jgi:hypothetical protein
MTDKYSVQDHSSAANQALRKGSAFTVLDPVPKPLLHNLQKLLEKKPLPMNAYRKSSGLGRSQCFGLVKQRDWTYSGSRLNFTRVDILDELYRISRAILPPDFRYTSIQLNQNYQTAAHTDKGNRGISLIVGFGDYEGGELLIEDQPVSIQYTPVLFDGSRLTHSTAPYTGSRFSIVFFTVDRDFIVTPSYSLVTYEGKDACLESMNGVDRIFSRRGQCVFASDGILPDRKKRAHVLRSAIGGIRTSPDPEEER